MIHRFSVSNFHSIREEVVLDLRIPATAPDLPRYRPSLARPDVRLPTSVVLIGPNASGKTTLLKALPAMASLAAPPSQLEQPAVTPAAIMPFASRDALGQPTHFRLDVEADWLAPDAPPQLFRYELAVGNDPSGERQRVFVYESLAHFPRGRARRLFERGAPGESIRVAGEISGELGIGSKKGRLRAIRDDSSVIASLAVLQVPVAARMAAWLEGLAGASNALLTETWYPPTEFVTKILKANPALTAWAGQRLRSSDLGIDGLDIQDTEDGSDGQSVSFRHHGLDVALPLVVQSGGTKRLFHLAPQLRIALLQGVPAVLDEIDGDLHVDIVREIIDWFRVEDSNPRRAQLLVTSHNAALLDDLEKEEVFIVEKTRDGATRVHGVQDVRGLRRDVRLYPKYRAGVLGGVPKIG